MFKFQRLYIISAFLVAALVGVRCFPIEQNEKVYLDEPLFVQLEVGSDSNITAVADSNVPDIYKPIHEHFAKAFYEILDGVPNPGAARIFDRIADEYIKIRQYFETAPLRDILSLHDQLLQYYDSPDWYVLASTKYGNFMANFRPTRTDFDRFSFTVVDYFLAPVIGRANATEATLKYSRDGFLDNMPNTGSPFDKEDLVNYVNTLVSRLENGRRIPYYVYKRP